MIWTPWRIWKLWRVRRAYKIIDRWRRSTDFPGPKPGQADLPLARCLGYSFTLLALGSGGLTLRHQRPTRTSP
jgi:hypothetical protein